MGRASIRAVDANPALTLAAVVVSNPAKVGRDAGDLADLGRDLGVAATTDVDAALAVLDGAGAVGVHRPRVTSAPTTPPRTYGARWPPAPFVVTPAIYALYDQHNAPAELRDPLLAAARAGGTSLFVTGVDPGWGNDLLPVIVSALAGEIDQVRCQEIFDYSTYDAPDAVRYAVGLGEPMEYDPPDGRARRADRGVGGQVHLVARALDVELEEVRETLERRPLEGTSQLDGPLRDGHAGRVPVRGAGHRRRRALLVVEHVTRIAPSARPTGRSRPTAGTARQGRHRGPPRLDVTIHATDRRAATARRAATPPPRTAS